MDGPDFRNVEAEKAETVEVAADKGRQNDKGLVIKAQTRDALFDQLIAKTQRKDLGQIGTARPRGVKTEAKAVASINWTSS